MMKKIISYFAVLAVLVFGVGEILRQAALRFDPNEPKVDRILNMQGKDYEIIYLGNSVTLQAIYPPLVDSLLGTHSFNFSVGGASLIESQVFLQHYLRHNAKPKLVVLGLFINEEGWSDRLRPTIGLGVDREVRQDYFQYLKRHRIDPEYAAKFYNRFAIFRHRTVIEHVLKYIVEPKERQYTFKKGFLLTTASNKVPSKLLPHECGINENGLRAFDEFCRQENIRVLYIEPPNSAVYNQSTLGREETLAAVQKIVGPAFVSFNQGDSRFDSNDWFGLNHFNVYGARKFTQIFVAYLQNGYFKNNELSVPSNLPVNMTSAE